MIQLLYRGELCLDAAPFETGRNHEEARMSALLIYVLEGTLGIAVLVFVAAFLGGVVARARRRRKNRA